MVRSSFLARFVFSLDVFKNSFEKHRYLSVIPRQLRRNKSISRIDSKYDPKGFGEL